MTYCTECGKECELVAEDEGIGAYEYWGAKGVDIRWVTYSKCCEAAVTDTEPEEDE